MQRSSTRHQRLCSACVSFVSHQIVEQTIQSIIKKSLVFSDICTPTYKFEPPILAFPCSHVYAVFPSFEPNLIVPIV
ncbi:hypothetical protein IAQ61_008443 [Plenodomus lingam]|uniref:uncharacterized protein n=1 Tax=Leptosphaeria maculans TaxID=5022 RepID=UPI00331CD08F|nr:hypothetical protein IAQ61_008443 [Plenodomus lingam]